jgi:MATE family multidrug resistance protein
VEQTATNDSGYSHREIWNIALPMILSAISTPLVGIVDTALMGHLDSPSYLAAVAAGATIFSVLFMGLNFLRMGTTGIAAQAFGSGDRQAVAGSLVQPVFIAVTLALALLVLQRPFADFSLWLLGVTPATGDLTSQYFFIRMWSAPMALSNFVLIGWLIGMQNGRAPLAMLLMINLTNVALDLAFVIGLNMDVRGVALATVLAETAGMLVGISYVRAVFRDRQLKWSEAGTVTLDNYRRLMGINANLFLRSMALMLTLAFITARGARFGDVFLAANALLMNFQLFLSYALDGIAHAAEALSGKALGARNWRGLDLAVRRTRAWTFGFAVLFTVVYAAGGSLIVGLLTDIEAVRATALDYLPWIIALPLLSAAAFLYDGVYVGTLWSGQMRVVMVGSALGVFLPVWYLTQGLANHGLWLAFVAFMLARSVAMHFWYRPLATRTQARLTG